MRRRVSKRWSWDRSKEKSPVHSEVLSKAPSWMRTLQDQARHTTNSPNTLVSVFMHTLKYYWGIMVLMINHTKNINDAVQSRISVALHYGPLGLDMRKTIWESFLKKVATIKGRAEYTTADLDWLSEKEVNGRQVHGWINTYKSFADPQSRSRTW